MAKTVLEKQDLVALKVFNDDDARTIFGLKQPSSVRWNVAKSKIKTTGGTRLYDAIDKTMSVMPYGAKYKKYHRQLVVLTDGEDNGSRMSYEALKARIKEPGIKNFHLILIGVNVSLEYETKLRTLCNKPHFRYLDCGASSEDIKKSFGRAKKVVMEYITTTTTETRVSTVTTMKGKNQKMISPPPTSIPLDKNLITNSVQSNRQPLRKKKNPTRNKKGTSCFVGGIEHESTKKELEDFFAPFDANCCVTSEIRYNKKHQAYFAFIKFSTSVAAEFVSSTAFIEENRFKKSKLTINIV
eukprot:CAMPEP_0168508698 /NCGR_PEP_ID=MMETSP0405-20121227/286_1 /TAXON_ID=498012 /ORGANISM="Trichosphaerium sp, Strain Am-I-7 wt" /LENGTH=297 /DNA_ID=CAMNT_0008525917 /DNA_START=124 /DNA_END=1017 /DNA_ORIENTATION=+